MKLCNVLVTVLIGPLCLAQVTIQNPRHLLVPEQEVEALHSMICRVVAKEFHVHQGRPASPVILVLGQDQERTVADEANGSFTIYLKRWNEVTFAMSDLQLAVQRVVLRDRWERMAREIVRRSTQITPVPVERLK